MRVYHSDHNIYEDEIKIKPKLIAKIPYKFFENGLKPLEFFIKLSPGLMFFKQQGTLIICVTKTSTQFYTDCERSYKAYKESFSENTAICNLVLFSEEYNKKTKNKIEDCKVMKFPTPEGSKLRQLLNDLHEGEDSGPTDILDCDWRDRRPKDE